MMADYSDIRVTSGKGIHPCGIDALLMVKGYV
jgi:hypothetical protein